MPPALATNCRELARKALRFPQIIVTQGPGLGTSYWSMQPCYQSLQGSMPHKNNTSTELTLYTDTQPLLIFTTSFSLELCQFFSHHHNPPFFVSSFLFTVSYKSQGDVSSQIDFSEGRGRRQGIAHSCIQAYHLIIKNMAAY